jgi:hypothetical protein
MTIMRKKDEFKLTCEQVVKRLLAYSYRELQDYKIDIMLGRTRAYAEVHWNQQDKSAEIRINKAIKKWRDPELIGLLSHEMSHIVQPESTEESTDFDVIKRGLGVYLAIERLAAGKYNDHILRKPKDRYLGYSTIRHTLRIEERRDLDCLLSKLSIIPVVLEIHDISVQQICQ